MSPVVLGATVADAAFPSVVNKGRSVGLCAPAVVSRPAPLPPPSACSLLRRLFPRMHPRFIHVLRVDADKLDAVK